ncbi:MAG: hypothetical protein J6H18_01860, partial [Lachnospiraceae bacterium]|nr:hypothetical protein [Lachnospiraceae bacterium]
MDRMKSEEMMEAIGALEDELLKTSEPAQTYRKRKKWYILAACALLAAALLWGGVQFFGRGEVIQSPKAKAAALGEPEYPPQKQWEDYYNNQTANLPDPAYERRQKNRGAGEGLGRFFSEITMRLLAGEEEENVVLSPLNIFMATAMLGEVTGGESRQEILRTLGVDNLEALREKARGVWELCYYDNGKEKTIPANSLWLSNDWDYHPETVDRLARDYYASVFQGEMGDSDYDKLLQDWLDENTGGLLTNQIRQLSFKPDTALRLISTLYLQTKWAVPFDPAQNRELPFHGSQGDQTVTFLHRDDCTRQYLYGPNFIILELSTFQGGSVWFFLPDEGVSLEEMIREEGFASFLEEPVASNYVKYDEKSDAYLPQTYRGVTAGDSIKINLSIPKLDLSCKLDLQECLGDMGIERCLEAEKADFSPLLKNGKAYLQEASHTSRLIMDEEGITAASYVDYLVGAALPPQEEIDIVLDRPFVFLITSRNLPLYAG